MTGPCQSSQKISKCQAYCRVNQGRATPALGLLGPFSSNCRSRDQESASPPTRGHVFSSCALERRAAVSEAVSLDDVGPHWFMRATLSKFLPRATGVDDIILAQISPARQHASSLRSRRRPAAVTCSLRLATHTSSSARPEPSAINTLLPSLPVSLACPYSYLHQVLRRAFGWSN